MGSFFFVLDRHRSWSGAVALVLLSAYGLAACGPEEPPPEIPEQATTDPAGVEGLFGLINVVDAGASAEVHGVFAQQLPATGVIDGLAWIGVGDPGNGYWVLPDRMDDLLAVVELEADLQWTDDQYHDVGEELTVAGVAATRITDWQDPDGFESADLIFYRDDGTVTSDQLGTITTIGFSWPGGEDVGAENRPGAVERVPPLELISHDVDVDQRWFEGTGIELQWEDDGVGEVQVSLLGDARWYHARVSGGTSFLLPAAVLDDAVEDTFEVRVSRVTAQEVAAGPGTVMYRYARERRLRFTRSGLITVEPDVLRLGETTELTLEHHGGTFEQDVTVFDLGDGVVIDASQVPSGTGAVAELSVTVAETAQTGVRDVVATTAADTVVSERMLTVLLPAAETCAQAFELPGEGLYHGVLAGGVNDYWDLVTCPGQLAEGPDSVFALALTDTQIVSATLYHQGVDAVLYLADACDAIEAPLTCSDIGGIDVAEFVSFVPDMGEGGTFYLVVDAYGEIPEEATAGFSLAVSLYEF